MTKTTLNEQTYRQMQTALHGVNNTALAQGADGLTLAHASMLCLMILNVLCWLVGVFQGEYLNNNIEQGNRFIRKLTRQMNGFKSVSSSTATLAGIEVAHMIRKLQFARFANPHSNISRLLLANSAR